MEIWHGAPDLLYMWRQGFGSGIGLPGVHEDGCITVAALQCGMSDVDGGVWSSDGHYPGQESENRAVSVS